MRRLFIVIEALLALFCSWTLAYHVVLLFRLPAASVGYVFIVVALLLVGPFVPSWLQLWKRSSGDIYALLGIGGLSLATGALTLFTSRPDNDDISFFHRALAQLQHLDQPFSITDTMHNLPGLPPLSLVHVMTSYEPLMALAAHWLGINPLSAYQNWGAFAAGTLLPIVYVSLYRQFRLSKIAAIVATSVALLFLILDGNEHRSFGNVALVRLWQGKTIVWTLLLPLTLLVAYRFMARPSLQRWSLVAMVAICGVGLSNSGIFLVPVLVFGVSAAYVLSYGVSRKHIQRAVLLNLASFYCIAIAAAVQVGLIPQPTDTTEWWIGWTWVWWENLNLVVGGWVSLARDILILVALPLVVLRKPLRRFPVLLTLVFIMLFATPITGPLWVKQLWPSGYWRLMYLLPLPWCAGLIGAGLMQWRVRRPALLVRMGAVLAVVLAIFGTYHMSVLSPDNGTMFKAARVYKFRPKDLAFANMVTAQLQGRNLLASENMIVVLALMNPTIKLEVARPSETLHAFRNANLEAEGLRRVAAQTLIATGQRSPTNDAALLQSLSNGVDALVLPQQALPAISTVMQQAPGHWAEAAHDPDYVLLLRYK